jgi:iron complex transport system substrate-binding protein
MAGGRNIAEDEEGTPTGMIPDIDPEWVIEQNPEIIIKLDLGFFGGYAEDDLSTLEDTRDEVINRVVLAHTDAVQNEEVYAISTGAFYLPYFHTSVVYLAKWFHPELFEDMDPEAIHQEYLEKYHIGSKDFTFVYPPMDD